jgi:hypothetical protein
MTCRSVSCARFEPEYSPGGGRILLMIYTLCITGPHFGLTSFSKKHETCVSRHDASEETHCLLLEAPDHRTVCTARIGMSLPRSSTCRSTPPLSHASVRIPHRRHRIFSGLNRPWLACVQALDRTDLRDNGDTATVVAYVYICQSIAVLMALSCANRLL